MLCYITLYYNILYYITLYYIIVYYIIIYYIMLHYLKLYYIYIWPTKVGNAGMLSKQERSISKTWGYHQNSNGPATFPYRYPNIHWPTPLTYWVYLKDLNQHLEPGLMPIGSIFGIPYYDPTCSMVLEYLATFTTKMTRSSYLLMGSWWPFCGAQFVGAIFGHMSRLSRQRFGIRGRHICFRKSQVVITAFQKRLEA